MSVNLSALAGAGWQFFDNDGVPLSGGLIYTYLAGTSTPAAVYTTNAGNIAHSNPIVLDSSGRVPEEVWTTTGLAYKFVLKNSSATQIWSKDNIVGINDFTDIYANLANTSDITKGDALIGFRQSNSSGNLSGSVGRTVHQKLQEFVSILDFGADPTGVADSKTAIDTAITVSISQKTTLYVPSGTYKYVGTGTAVLLAGSLIMRGDGIGKSIINFDGNQIFFNITTTIDSPLILTNIQFGLSSPTTNTNSTLFFTSNSVNFGSCFQVDQCSFQAWTNTTIHAIRAFNSSMKDCTIQGPDAYGPSSGYLPGKNSAGIRVWGADGTLTVQDHSFSNLCVFERITVKNVLYGFDFWNMNVASIVACTFESSYIGLIIRPNPDSSVQGFVSSAEKGGFGYALCYVESCWFEGAYKYYILNYDYDPATDTAVNPNRTALVTQASGGQTNYNNDETKVTSASYPVSVFRGGIGFYNAPGLGNSSVLHDYEEGTWTPLIVNVTSPGTSPTITYTTQIGKYTKVGDTVTVSANIVCTTVTGGTAGGTIIINGLPYLPVGLAGTGTFGGLGHFDTVYSNTNGQFISPVCSVGLPYVYFCENSAASYALWTVDKILANFTCNMTMTYRTIPGS
jgi:hypothetical protein